MFFENGRRYLSGVDTKAKAHVLALFENRSLQIGKHVIFRDEAIDFFVRGIVDGPEGESGVMSMRDWPSGVDTRDLPLAAMNPRPLRVSRILARVASVPMPSFSFKTALALASETKRWMLAIASISEPSENLEGGVVFFLRASTSAQSTASLLPTDGRTVRPLSFWRPHRPLQPRNRSSPAR